MDLPKKNTKNGRNYKLSQKIVMITDLPYMTLFLIWLGMVFAFGLIYFVLSSLPGTAHHGPITLDQMAPWPRFLNSLYYSVITATTTGYGDITPRGISKLFASVQCITGFFVFAIFVTKLVARRQEISLNEVHRLTFEEMFHNTRENLFIIRKDFDGIMKEVKETKTLSPHSWKNLTIAYEQAQTLIQEIPDFYDDDSKLYMIDPKREQLLLEAVHRTLERINQLLDTMSLYGVDWTSNEESMKELEELIEIIDTTAPLWRERSPYDKMEAFEDIINLKDAMHQCITSALSNAKNEGEKA